MRTADSINSLRPLTALLRLAMTLGLGVAVAGCGSAPKGGDSSTADLAADAVPKVEPKSRYGNMSSYVVLGKRYYTKDSSRNHRERGQASWYGKKFHGRKTSSGERYDMHQMTAAHKSLPLPTYALVTNLENGRSAVVKVNDRGPFVGNRIIDLSYAAAKRLDMVHAGTAPVEVRSIDPRDHGKDGKELLRLASADLGARGAKPSAAFAMRADGAAGNAVLDRDAASASLGRGRVAAAKTQAADGKPIFLQVGAFGSLGNAQQLKSRLTRRVEEPVVVRTAAPDSASTPMYKVQVGPLRSRTDADALGQRLAALGIEKPVLVVD